MRKAGMSIHSEVSLNESKAINMLSLALQEKNTIKTFLTENDKTPNYDGVIELINRDYTPKKQFIVQVKKVENLSKNRTGKNKGKYCYALNTKFLYYVKEKVTENPAIYFVVDIVTKKIFWIYLSDEKLMELDFEDKTRVNYYFSDDDIIHNIDDFTKRLNKIAKERNLLFVHRTPEEIAMLQDAADYINNLLSNDFNFIKKYRFPSLWRFGIKNTNSTSGILKINGHLVANGLVSTYALYPQIKGQVDLGYKMYDENGQNFFNMIDFTGRSNPIEYSKDCFAKILKDYFDIGIAFEYLPTIAIFEHVYKFVERTNNLFGDCSSNQDITLEAVFRRVDACIQYIDYLINDSSLTQEEIALKEIILDTVNGGGTYDAINICCSTPNVEAFKNFILKNYNFDKSNLNELRNLSNANLKLVMMLAELDRRNEEKVMCVWKYKVSELKTLSDKDYFDVINNICKEWLEKLPRMYTETYDKIFINNRYRIKGRYLYRNTRVVKIIEREVMSYIEKYKDDNLVILNDENIINATDKKFDNGLECTFEGSYFKKFLYRKTMFSDSITCLIYNGICKELGIKREDLGKCRLNLFD